MNWLELQKKVYDITKTDKPNKSKSLFVKNTETDNTETDNTETDNTEINKLKDYILISRHNLDDLEIGMHIKYIKKAFNVETGEVEEHIYNGGFLLDIINGDKIVKMDLLLKSNIVWKLKFLKYEIYGKSKDKFNTSDNIKNNIKNNLKDIYKDIIDERKKEYDLILNDKLKTINQSKSKYKIDFV